MSPACTRTTRMVGTIVRSQVTAAIGPRRTCSHVLTPSMLSTRNHTNVFTSPFSPWLPTRLAVFMRMPSACFITSQPFKPPATSTTRASSGERSKTITLAIGMHPFFVVSKLISASFLRLSARSSGMPQLASLVFLQGRAARDGGVVSVTSRYTYGALGINVISPL